MKFTKYEIYMPKSHFEKQIEKQKGIINRQLIIYNYLRKSLMRNGRHKKQNRSNLSLIPEKQIHLQNQGGEIDGTQEQYQSNMYNKIKSFVIKSNNMKSLMRIQKKRDRSSSNKSIQVLVRSEQQKQLMSYFGPRVFPVLVESPVMNKYGGIKQKKVKSKSVLDNILSERQKFMRTYFADIKEHRKWGDQQQISYIFPQIREGGWRIAGYIKGKYVLVKADHKKGKSVVKKYLYSEVYKELRKNYEGWIKDHFTYELESM